MTSATPRPAARTTSSPPAPPASNATASASCSSGPTSSPSADSMTWSTSERGKNVRKLRIGLAQCRQTGDFATNAATIRRFLEEASRAGVQALCFPETQTVGYRVDIATPDLPVPVAQLEDLHGEVARFCGRAGMACVLGTEIPHAGK